MSSIDLGRTLRKLLAPFRTFQHQFSPDGNRNQCTHAAALSPPSWNAMHTVVDVHPRPSTERIWGDTDLWFCTYTCTELPCVPLCCHFATYYSYPEKKKSPGIKWSAHVYTYLCCCTMTPHIIINKLIPTSMWILCSDTSKLISMCWTKLCLSVCVCVCVCTWTWKERETGCEQCLVWGVDDLRSLQPPYYSQHKIEITKVGLLQVT